ncbi:MAG: FAD-dependent monooxygenase [Pseudomonadota bacterium]|nr:FAD-dependent monooxygenase [Pseudomonadota bacterium]
MFKPKVLIVGASIAGPTAAFWLARAGCQVTIVEQASELRNGGNGVDIRTEALQVVQRMGLMASVRAKAIESRGIRFVNARDIEQARIDSIELASAVGSEDIEIQRGDLVHLLYDATRHDVGYVFGETISSYSQDEGGVDVTFTSGSQERFDLVVGADGMHSSLRRLAFGPEEKFSVYKHYYFAGASADLRFGEEYWSTFYNVPGKGAGFYRAGQGNGLITFIFFSEKPLIYDHRDPVAQRRLLREAYDGIGWHVPAMLDATDSATSFYFDSLSQVKMPSWSSGRITLVGDAAYCASPGSGAGALLALTGAYRLGGEVAAGGTLKSALARYEIAHRPLVKRKQTQLYTGLSAPKTRIGIVARNFFLSSPLRGMFSGVQSDKDSPMHDYVFPEAACQK